MALPFKSAPESICILRLSAVGDISHTMPVINTIRKTWPDTKLTWIIGKTEYQLVHDIDGIEFIQFDKRKGLSAYRDIRRSLKGRQFDILLDMQMSLRASLIALMVKTPIKLGFDRKRAKDMQWLFTNHKIRHSPQQHVIDSFFGFTEAMGIEQKFYEWDIPVPDDARHIINKLPVDKPYLVISPCSSMAYRNWNAPAYAAVADYAIEQYGVEIVLCGGRADIEFEYAEQITKLMQHSAIDLIGQTSLKELLAVLEHAQLVIAPDAGPAHLANAVGTAVLGLYATTNPDRARPYNSAEWTANVYPQAVQNKYGKPVEQLPWGIRVRDEGTMDLITVPMVKDILDRFMQTTASK